MRLGSPRIVIFTRVARELAHNNPVNLCQKKKFGRPYSEPWLFFLCTISFRIYMSYILQTERT